MSTGQQVFVSGGFDDIRSRDIRFLEDAASFGPLNVVLWSDRAIEQATGGPPKFPMAERLYFLQAVRYVTRVIACREPIDPDGLPETEIAGPALWVDRAAIANDRRQAYCRRRAVEYHVLPAAQMAGFSEPAPIPSPPGRKKIVATGCYDWFHTGHVRFTEEVSAFGDLYVIVGHDANIRLLKGNGHPLFSEDERRYVVGSIKYVKQALISTGSGWLDADPEIRRLKPNIYAVNEDGDHGGKRGYCQRLGIEYLVLKRTPAAGLPPRSSTPLRGF
jgi:cytidyltransferase-like protein